MPGHECLGDAVIHITHPTVFSVTYPFEAASCGRRSALLEAFPHRCVLCTFMLDTSAAVCHGPRPVISNGDLPDAAVYADNNGHIIPLRSIDMLCNRNMQKTALCIVKDEPGRSEFVCRAGNHFIKRIPFGKIADPDTLVERVDGKAVCNDRPVTVPHQVALHGVETHNHQFMSIGLHRFVLCQYGPDNRLGHLGFQTKVRTERAVQRIVQSA